ncbi:hypothetical protein [Streptomyces collinus]|uniref:hypothetical protein n=1 Tax=Streptomyces collinus TaxID=42684 RepID=UPI0036865E0E
MTLLCALRRHHPPRSLGRLTVGLLVLLAGTLPSGAADAATPPSGSVGDTAPTTT